jgi:hypothetical protein
LGRNETVFKGCPIAFAAKTQGDDYLRDGETVTNGTRLKMIHLSDIAALEQQYMTLG